MKSSHLKYLEKYYASFSNVYIFIPSKKTEFIVQLPGNVIEFVVIHFSGSSKELVLCECNCRMHFSYSGSRVTE